LSRANTLILQNDHSHVFSIVLGDHQWCAARMHGRRRVPGPRPRSASDPGLIQTMKRRSRKQGRQGRGGSGQDQGTRPAWPRSSSPSMVDRCALSSIRAARSDLPNRHRRGTRGPGSPRCSRDRSRQAEGWLNSSQPAIAMRWSSSPQSAALSEDHAVSAGME
jgi:hypothetical protein